MSVPVPAEYIDPNSAIDLLNGPAAYVEQVRGQDAPPSITQWLTFESLSESNLSSRDAIFDQILSECNTELDEYQSYDDGWDGYSGVKFSSSVIASAKSIVVESLNVFKKENVDPAEIIPGPASDGSVDIEIVKGSRRLIFTLNPDKNEVIVFRQASNFPSTEQEIELDATSLGEYCHWLAG